MINKCYLRISKNFVLIFRLYEFFVRFFRLYKFEICNLQNIRSVQFLDVSRC